MPRNHCCYRGFPSPSSSSARACYTFSTLCMAQIQRRKTCTTTVGGVRVGCDAPIVVQSMTNTDTADIDGTIRQCAALARAGSELVRVTVNNDAAAAAVPHIVDGLDRLGIPVPIIGDFHYN